MTIILGIESTCDETGCAIVREGNEILSNIIASQIDLHNKYGGVVPELACRRHIDVIIPVINQALEKANIAFGDIDAIAVAQGPGLIGALLIGINTAKALAFALKKPLIGINHVEAHIYAAIMNDTELSFPSLGVILSGGHTVLIKILKLGHYQLIGQTVDDAIGEAFDKVASMLDLPYPGGPFIEEIARLGDKTKYPFRACKVRNQPLNFSFSGLKTSVLYNIKGQNSDKNMPLHIDESEKKHVAASFQEAALNDVVSKSVYASQKFNCKSIVLGGGVTNNQRLREKFAEQNLDIPILWPPKNLSLDNAAMIAGLGFHYYKNYNGSYKSYNDSLDMEAMTKFFFD